MRFGQLSASRLPWFDRARTSGITQVTNTVGPTAQTQVLALTVPIGKSYALGPGQLRIDRVTAAGAVGRVTLSAYLNIGGGNIVLASCRLYTNNVGDKDVVMLPPTLYLNGGEQFSVYYEDLSTTGTIQYTASMAYAAFNP